jgi:spore maturation protein CgeB
MKVVVIGLSITSSWGNGHATNYRALVAELDRRGHEVLFCERDVPWYAAQRDLTEPPGGRLCLYESVEQLRRRAGPAVAAADLVILGSYVPEGATVADWLLGAAGGAVAFYDIDTPITVQKLADGDREYLGAEQVREFDLYLSFTGGPTLEVLRERFGARRPLQFYCLVDPAAYRPQPGTPHLDLGYLGTYSEDRQPAVDELLLAVARRRPGHRFALAGSSYPPAIEWPANVTRIDHLPPSDHSSFYADQRFTLNVTRDQMRRAGFSPSVRLFEAAACGVPVISDEWPGLDEVFVPGEEILIASDRDEVIRILDEVDEPRRHLIGRRARERVLGEHTAAQRVALLEHEVARGRPRQAAAAG